MTTWKTTPPSWTPLLPPAERERVRTVLRCIQDYYLARLAAQCNASAGDPGAGNPAATLGTDDCVGAALLFDYCQRALPGVPDAAAGEAFLDLAIDALATEDLPPRLLGGFLEVTWAVEHLAALRATPPTTMGTGTEGGPDADADGLTEIDETLVGYSARTPWPGHYDVVTGLGGIGVYALERMPRHRARTILEQVVAQLDRLAERTNAGVTWHTPLQQVPPLHRREAPAGFYNLGLAHGVPGIIAVLAGAAATGVATERAWELLDGAVAWLLSRQLPPDAGSCFSPFIVPGAVPQTCRLGWCYGDAGISIALLLAARLVHRQDWERKAIAIALSAAGRSLPDSRVEDALLCHGTAGLGHIFNRLWQATGDARLWAAARFWLGDTLRRFDEAGGLDGFASINQGQRESGTGLLAGCCGVGLALAAAACETPPNWDRIMLMSVPGRRTGRET